MSTLPHSPMMTSTVLRPRDAVATPSPAVPSARATSLKQRLKYGCVLQAYLAPWLAAPPVVLGSRR